VKRGSLILASASPRRADILRMLGIEFQVAPTDVPEVREFEEPPEVYVERLARSKSAAGAAQAPDRWVLAGDTVVAFRGDILEKPTSTDDALDMLQAMAGNAHTVFSGLALASPDGETLSRVDRADVWFRDFDLETAHDYLKTGEPFDKAGAYGIQGFGAALVERVDGDFYTVVGMSVAGLIDLLARAGRPYDFPK